MLKDKTTKSTHGGPGRGQGRKTLYKEPTTQLSFRVPESCVEEIKAFIKKKLEEHKQ